MSQLFIKSVPINILFDFLEKINCVKTENYYIVDVTAYKRSVYLNVLQPFLLELKEYYYLSKHSYINNENMNHNRFNTVIRQICNFTNTHYTKGLRKGQLKYSVVYNIYFLQPSP
jgi:hypothetical protein